jgi:hypothetical protein
MRIESALSLQEELMQNLILPAYQTQNMPPGDPVSARINEKTRATSDLQNFDGTDAFDIALGIGYTTTERSPDNFGIIAFCQTRRAMDGPIASEAQRRARGSIRFVHSGRPRARSVTAWHRAVAKPLVMGASIGHSKSTAGTLGAFVQLHDGAPCVLSNDHVLVDQAATGGISQIVQPGPLDGGAFSSRIIGGVVANSLLEISRTRAIAKSFDHTTDAAVAVLRDKVEFDPVTLRDSSGHMFGSFARRMGPPVMLDDVVRKVGRTTGYTQGFVSAVRVRNVMVNYGPSQFVCFEDQIAIHSLNGNRFSAGGDSGALILNRDNEAVGLLFACTQTGGFENTGVTFANPIETVLRDLDVTFL